MKSLCTVKSFKSLCWL